MLNTRSQMKDLTTKKRKAYLREKTQQIRTPEHYAWKILNALNTDLGGFLSDDADRSRLDHVIRTRDIDGYLQLSEEWGLQCINTHGYLQGDTLAKYQLSQLLKKYEFETSKELREANARKKFFAAEERCKTFNEVDSKYLSNPCDAWNSKILSYARSFLLNLLGEYIPHGKLVEWSRHGPGANLDTAHGTTDLFNKFANLPYSCTLDAYRYARARISCDQRWMGALQDYYRASHGIPMHHVIDVEDFWKSTLTIVDSNRIFFVPKDARTMRSIAIEPALNIYLQLGVDGYIRRRLKSFCGIDLDSQVKNQVLAYRGSINGELATIDLASASDTLSKGLCKLLLPEYWFSYLMDLSAQKFVLDNETFAYAKISSMGNGFTFALETILFTALVYAVEKVVTKTVRWDSIAIYGDDIIVPTDISRFVTATLRTFGLATNPDKTFEQGPVRESCGTDWFRGVPLRPVYIRFKPEAIKELFTDRNRLQRILDLRFGLKQSRVVDLLDSWIPPLFRNMVGPISDEEMDSYIHVAKPPSPIGPLEPNAKKAFVGGLWRFSCLRDFRESIGPSSKRLKDGFLFRKLMATLPPCAKPNGYAVQAYYDLYDGDPTLKAGGDIFAVYRNKRYATRVKDSAAGIWQTDYSARARFSGLPL